MKRTPKVSGHSLVSVMDYRLRVAASPQGNDLTQFEALTSAFSTTLSETLLFRLDAPAVSPEQPVPSAYRDGRQDHERYKSSPAREEQRACARRWHGMKKSECHR